MDDLANQISQIKMSAGIDEIVEELAQQKMKIYGGSYVYWKRERPEHPYEGYPLPWLNYISQHIVALCIAPEEKNISSIRVTTGWEPPQSFDESKLEGIDFVTIDGRQVWSRKEAEKLDDDEIPF